VFRLVALTFRFWGLAEYQPAKERITVEIDERFNFTVPNIKVLGAAQYIRDVIPDTVLKLTGRKIFWVVA
jgi:hypothetical protein